MTLAFQVSSLLLLLAVFILQIKAETQWVAGSDAEEEEKDLNILFGNVSSRSTSPPKDNSSAILNAEDELLSEDGNISWRTEENFTEYDKLHEDETKNNASPLNNVDNESKDEVNPHVEYTFETDTAIFLDQGEEYSTQSSPFLEHSEAILETVSTVAPQVSSTFNDFICAFSNEKCKSLHSVATEELESSRVKDKFLFTTPSVTSYFPFQWSVMKSIKPQQLPGELSDVFTLQKTSRSDTTTASNPESSTVQTSENLILVEGSVVSKDESVILNHTSKSDKSKQLKETFVDFSEERHLRTLVKTLTTTPMTSPTKSPNINPWPSTLLTRLFEVTTVVYNNSELEYDNESRVYSSLSIPIEYPTLKSMREVEKGFEIATPVVSPSPELSKPFTDFPSTVIWGDAKHHDFSKDEKITIQPSSSIPSSSTETITIQPETTESLSSSFPQNTYTPLDDTSPSRIFTPYLEPRPSSRIVVKDTVTVSTTPAEDISPPRITNPECSSLPVCFEITLLETSWEEFCAETREFQRFIYQAVSPYTRPLHPHQIVLETEKCSWSPNAHQLQGTPDVSVFFYVTDDSGEYEEKLTEICGYILRKWAPTSFRNSIMEVRLYNEVTSTPRPVIPELNSGFVAAVSISAVAGVALCLLCILLVIMKQKLLQGRNSETTSPTADAYSLDSLSINASFRRRRTTRRSARSYLNHAFTDQEFPSHPLNEKSLQNCLKNRDLLEEEFKKIPMNMPKLDQIPEGAHVKNRYSNILPKPESRVVLAEPSGDPLKCYINANYIKGYEGKPACYIACQAPLPEGIEDFWRMIWEQQSRVIVMLTKFEENGIARCAMYFPQSTLVAHPPYGDFQVSLLKKDVYEFYTMSTLRLLDMEKNLFRDIVHLWYTDWPDVGVPKDPTSLITFVQQCRSFIDCNSGPTIVHCSTGTGRTGVFLSLDICMREYDESRSIDILQCISQLRRDRGGAVQNKDQYILIYEAMLEYVSRMTNQSQRPSINSTS